MDSSLGQRIKEIRGKESQDVFAVKIGISRGSLSAYERGENQPPADTLKEICTKYQISANWLLLGYEQNGNMNEQNSSMEIQKNRPSLAEISMPSQEYGQPCDVDLILVPMVEARLSAGIGSLETGGGVEREYAFRSDFLRRKGNPDNMVLMRVGGDSMEPEIMNKDVVLIDQGKKNIIAGQIFAVGFEEAIYLKRIDMLPGKIILKSANPAYPPLELPIGEQSSAFRIIGQVLWCGREY